MVRNNDENFIDIRHNETGFKNESHSLAIISIVQQPRFVFITITLKFNCTRYKNLNFDLEE